nr:hypothetical protein [Tanacetum cinerariifolium]
KLARNCRVLTEDVVMSLSVLIYCRDLDKTTFRDLVDYDGKHIPEDPQPGVPRVVIPRPPRKSIQDFAIFLAVASLFFLQWKLSLLAVGMQTPGSGNTLHWQWELSPGSGNALCILFPTIHPFLSIIVFALITAVIVFQFRAVSFKVSLSSTLIVTVALLIIVVVDAVVVGVVVIITVVVVVGICRSASTVPGQMANHFAIIVPRPGQCSASYSAVAGSDCF